jgi:ribosomal protein S8
MSKPSKSFFISLKALKLVSSRLDGVIILVSTTRGVITHREAINKSLSGFVFAYFFV